jgi:NhaP-type Na+/H+ or K+/H+ antiporter
MHEPLALMAVAAVMVGYALTSRRLSTTPLSGPIVFVTAGVLIGPTGLNLIHTGGDRELIRAVLEIALVLVLFTDAMTIRSTALRRQDFVPIRLLAIGLPLTMLLGWAVAIALLPGIDVWEAALVGVILAPTDAALGLATISNPRVPQLIRQSLNVESGLNDGMALPFFTIALAAAAESADPAASGALEILVRALVLSTALGAAAGWGAGRLLALAQTHGWVDDAWARIAVVAVALGAYGLALSVDGSGFISAWVAGLAFGAAIAMRGGSSVVGRSAGFAEDLGGLFVALSYLVFGAVILGPVIEQLDWRPLAYAVLSLTVIRAVPVALSLLGTGLRRPTVLYVGWFGPRGLASIVFGLIAVEEAVPGIAVISETIAATVALSVVLHGVTSVWGSNRYGDWYEAAAAEGGALVEGGTAPDRSIRRSPLAGDR